MKETLKITKEYYIDFLVKFVKEFNYHEDYLNLNLKKFKLLNELTNMKDYIEISMGKHTINFSFINIKEITLNNKNNSFDIDLNKKENIDKLVLYYNFLLNNVLEKTKINPYIQNYIQYETNSIFEFAKETLDLNKVDKNIGLHSIEISYEYRKLLLEIFNIVLNNNKNIKWDLEIKDLKQIELLNKRLYDIDYM